MPLIIVIIGIIILLVLIAVFKLNALIAMLISVLIDSGVSDYIADILVDSSISPLILAWLITTVIRVCVGSATVAGLIAAIIILPLISSTGASAELMVLGIGAGSLMLSHVNDSGFWMFKEYFNLSLKDTLKT